LKLWYTPPVVEISTAGVYVLSSSLYRICEHVLLRKINSAISRIAHQPLDGCAMRINITFL